MNVNAMQKYCQVRRTIEHEIQSIAKRSEWTKTMPLIELQDIRSEAERKCEFRDHQLHYSRLLEHQVLATEHHYLTVKKAA